MIREVDASERKNFDELALHPMQVWAWGEFREKTGLAVSRLGRYVDDKLRETAQITWHKIPKIPLCVGYWPKGEVPSDEMIEAVKEEAKKRRAIFVKMEPNVLVKEGAKLIDELEERVGLVKGSSLFTKWSFWLDLTKTPEELMADMKGKTRYNVRYAEKKGVKVMIDNSDKAFEEYWRLSKETMDRQGFYAHSKDYHQKMFSTLNEAGIANLFRAEWKGKTLVTWIIFELNRVIYYPYGGSTREDQNVQANSAMMWEVIKWGKKRGNRLFDMWGSPGPEPKESDPWYGFHRFKTGFGAELVEFLGTYDLVVSPVLYRLYQTGNSLRWVYLKMKK